MYHWYTYEGSVHNILSYGGKPFFSVKSQTVVDDTATGAFGPAVRAVRIKNLRAYPLFITILQCCLILLYKFLWFCKNYSMC